MYEYRPVIMNSVIRLYNALKCSDFAHVVFFNLQSNFFLLFIRCPSYLYRTQSLEDKNSHLISNTNAVREFFLSNSLMESGESHCSVSWPDLCHSNSSKLGFVHNFVGKNGEKERDFFPPLKLVTIFFHLCSDAVLQPHILL